MISRIFHPLTSRLLRLSWAILLIHPTVNAQANSISHTGNPHPCYLSGISDQLRCGYVEVPENPAKPDGRIIRVHYAVLPAIKPSFPDEAFLAIAGGPGQSAIDSAASFDRMFRKVRQNRDLLLIDQRGTGLSNRLDCDSQAQDALAINDESFDTLADAKRCLDSLDADVSQYGSLSALADFEAVRMALGYQKLHVYGVSYGTRMAQLYLRHYPQAIATVTLDGVVPMQQSVLAIGEAVDRAVTLMLQDCATSSSCQERFPQLAADLDRVHQRLAVTPMNLAVHHPLTGEPQTFLLTRAKFATVVRLALYSANTRALLPFAIHQAANGNYQSILGLYGVTLDNLELASGMHNAVVCGEDLHRIDAALQGRIESSYYGKQMLEGLQKTCSVWQMPTVNAEFADGVQSSLPVLLLSGELDPATPPSWADMAMEHLSNARHFIAPYSGHGVARSACAAGIVAEFVSEASVERLDSQCLTRDIRRGFYLNASTVEPIPEDAGQGQQGNNAADQPQARSQS